MKSEKRHQLEQNDLADWIGQAVLTIKPYVGMILVLALAAMAIFVCTSWWWRHSAAGDAAAWDKLFVAMNDGSPSKIEQVVDDYQGTRVSDWGTVILADQRLASGCEQLQTNRTVAIQELTSAVAGYDKVLERAREPQLRERALYGRGRANEALAGTRQGSGNLDKAIADYEQAAKVAREGVFGKLAARRIEELRLPETQKFYQQFAQYEPKSMVDQPGTPGKRPDFDPSKLEDDDFTKLLNQTDVKSKSGKTAEGKTEAKKTEPAKTEAKKTEPAKAEPKNK